MSTKSSTRDAMAAKVDKIIDLGKSWGMSEADIQECLQSVANEGHIGANLSSPEDGKNHAESFSWQIFNLLWSISKWTACSLLLVVITMCVFYTLLPLFSVWVSPRLEIMVGRLADPAVYPLVRLWRIMFKPLADRLAISTLYTSDCAIRNPYYLEFVDNCEPCSSFTQFLDLTNKEENTMTRSIDTHKPFVLRGQMKSKVNLTLLHRMYFQNENIFKTDGSQKFESNLDRASSISDFFYNYNHEALMTALEGEGYVSWEMKSVASSQATRRFFRKPQFVTKTAEVSLLKRIYIEGPTAVGHELLANGFGNSWYTQAHGTRQVTLSPHPYCADRCKKVGIVLHAGDVVFYQDNLWTLVSEPPKRGLGLRAPKDVNIGFTSSFS